MDTNKFTESRRVIITDSFGITKSFQHRISLHNLIFQITLQCNRISDWWILN